MSQDDTTDAGRDYILSEIDRRKRGQWRMTIPDLMQLFGYAAARRVHQASLQNVLALLAEWGVGFRLPGGTSAYDEIVLFRETPVAVTAVTTPPPTLVASEAGTAPAAAPTLTLIQPLVQLFSIDGLREEDRAGLRILSLHSALWALRPVCLFVDASDDLFHFLCGYTAAIMRRRALMSRDSFLPTSPEIVSVETLRRVLGRTDNTTGVQFPVDGAVYLLRQNPDDQEDDEIVQTLRDSLLPNTFSFQGRDNVIEGMASKNGDSGTEVAPLIQWFAAFTGTLQALKVGGQHTVSMASLLSEAVRTRELLLDRRTLQPSDEALRSGFESTEHVVLKGVVLGRLRERYPTEQIAVEESISRPPGSGDEQNGPLLLDRHRKDRPDIRVGDWLWVEVETLRSLALRGSNPFFELEAKLRQKLKNMASAREIWLLVPSDVATLAGEQIAAIARNLNHALGANKVRCGFVDLLTGDPIMLAPGEAPQPEPVRLYGVLVNRERPKSQQLRWEDIAGYNDVKRRLHDDLLDPLVNRQRYTPFGIVAANGVLLYGLPGCGKSLIGQVIAGEAAITCRLLKPSDLTSMWLGEGVMKIRAIFDWALRQAPCVLVLDELDAVAPQRQESNMHTDEKRQVNELLAQLSRITDQGVIVVGTTNYARGIDTAIQRSGRFDVKLPIFPPDEADRAAIFRYYLQPPRLAGFREIEAIDEALLAQATSLYTPADIKAVVHTAARKAIRQAVDGEAPVLTTNELLDVARGWPRSIRRDQALDWIVEAALELGGDPKLQWLREEVIRAYGTAPNGQ